MYILPNVQKQDICSYGWHHFGDVWAYTNLLLKISERSGQPIKVGIENQKIRKTILQIRPFLKSKGKIVFSNRLANLNFSYCDPYNIRFVPSVRTWNYKRSLKSKIVAYQFDGNHLAEQKNLPWDKIQFLINSLKRMGYEPVNVGGYKKMNFIINTLSNCKFFVGCPSGLSVAARSVGCPINLITWKLGYDMIHVLKTCQCPTAKFFPTVKEFLSFTKTKQSGLITLL
jgi:hypothetical protein